MSQMNYQVGVEGKPAAQVARDFLVKEGLIKKLTNHSQVFALENFLIESNFISFQQAFGVEGKTFSSKKLH